MSSKDEEVPPAPIKPMRLQRLLAQCGLGSRRDCEELITAGRVTIDGKVADQLGSTVIPGVQTVELDGERLKVERKKYFMLNKPSGYLCTSNDPEGRRVVLDLFPEEGPRLFTVGRLDENTTGLLIVTNDGDLAQKLAHPRYRIFRTYTAQIAGQPKIEVYDQLKQGLFFTEGKFRVHSVKQMKKQKDSTWVEITMTEGQNREIRRLFARVGHKIMKLERLGYGPLRLGKLARGEYRELTREELADLHGVLERNRAEEGIERPARRPAAPRGTRTTDAGRPERSGRFSDRERPERGDRPARGTRPERGERPTGGSRRSTGDRPDRGDRPYGSARSSGDRPSRGPRPDRGDRPDREERSYGASRPTGDRPARGGRPAGGPRPERGDRPQRQDRPERSDRPERGSPRGERPQRDDRGDRPERRPRSEFGAERGKPFARGERSGPARRTDSGAASERRPGRDYGDRPSRGPGGSRDENSGRPRRSESGAERGGRPERRQRAEFGEKTGEGRSFSRDDRKQQGRAQKTPGGKTGPRHTPGTPASRRPASKPVKRRPRS